MREDRDLRVPASSTVTVLQQVRNRYAVEAAFLDNQNTVGVFDWL